MFGNSARHDTIEMREVRFNVDRNTMVANPPPHTHADSGNLLLTPATETIRPAVDPNADPPITPLAAQAEPGESCYDPVLQPANIIPAHPIGVRAS